MRAVWAVAIGAIGTLAGAVIADMVHEEIRARLEQFPAVVIRLAARRLPANQRRQWIDEWLAELHYILRGTEALPITRLARGTWFAVSLLVHGARTIGRELAKRKRPLHLAVGWLQAARERRAAARLYELQVPRTRLIDALMAFLPQDVALLTARESQKLAQDLAMPGRDLPVSRLAIHRNLLAAVRLYVDQTSNNRRLWPDPQVPTSLREMVDATERIIRELEQRTDGGNSPSSISRGEVERYAGRLTAQSYAFQQFAVSA